MEYKRLTHRNGKTIEEYCEVGHCKYADFRVCNLKGIEHNVDEECVPAMIERLAELEDKIEQGKMIELPCKVGDTIYWISSNNRDIIEAVVEKISFTKYDRVILLVEEKGVGEYSIPLVWDIFLTREEAEKKLKELQNG